MNLSRLGLQFHRRRSQPRLHTAPRIFALEPRRAAPEGDCVCSIAAIQMAAVPPLTCYRIRSRIDGRAVKEFEDALEFGNSRVSSYGPIRGPGFVAQLFVTDTHPHEVRWGAFLKDGFGMELDLASASSPAAVLLVDVGSRRRDLYAFTFGIGGRFLLREGSYERGYGLRTALNLVYPRSAPDLDLARLRAIDSKRRGATTMRARHQASHASTFETFDVNRLRDEVNAATGIPADPDAWGRRIGGSDSLGLSVEISFDQLGTLCRQISAAHGRDDYQERFGWIDFVRPVDDPNVLRGVEAEVVRKIHDDDIGNLDLAPPEIVDWERVDSFHYPFERRTERAGPVTHPDLRLSDLVRLLQQRGKLEEAGIAFLRRHHIEAVDSGDRMVHRWTIWRSLVGEMELRGRIFILDEGEVFEVQADYLAELDQFIDRLPEAAVALPSTPISTTEQEYNHAAASAADLLLLDRRLVRIRSRTTPIEVCDLLSRDGELIHVKRHLGSSDLSHLFAQGAISAELLQMNVEFRSSVRSLIRDSAGSRPEFDVLADDVFDPQKFEVVYAIVERWRDRSLAEALPFFSKVNLREFASNLASRDFRVSMKQVAAT